MVMGQNYPRWICVFGPWKHCLLTKGIDPAALDKLIETYETKVGPHNGARVVARAWGDADYKHWLMEDAP